MFNSRLEKFIAEGKKGYIYWLERLKLDFAVQLEKRRVDAGMSYVDYARLMDTTPAYISKVFRGDTNLTMESMVKLARVTNGKVDLRILNEDAVTNPNPWLSFAPAQGSFMITNTESVAITALQCSNDDHMPLAA